MGGAERRVACRDRSFARVLLPQEGRVGYVADLSDTGFKGLFPEAFPLSLGADSRIGVSFEEIEVGYFEVTARARWCRLSASSLEVGYEILREPTDPESLARFERIRAYYAGSGPQLDCP